VDDPFPAGAFSRIDETPDLDFYAEPRLVNHIDAYAIRAVGAAYAHFLTPGGDYLDLMSSWVSHYPASLQPNRVVGHGMNAVELRENPLLSAYFVQDLNREPTLPLPNASFDGVTICVSVQYLTQPVAVFAEIGRVLKPGAPLIVAYSNRCFPTKAVSIWQVADDEGHARLISAYAEQTGAFEAAAVYDFSPRTTGFGVPDDPVERHQVAMGEIYTDPVYVVIARKRAD
jgi:SAM-dependent methyltransferase